MKNFVFMTQHDAFVSVVLPIDNADLLVIGDNMEAIREEAYMNGYNWEAFMARYLQLHHPSLTQGMDSDPEAGTYVAYYSASPPNEAKARELTRLLNELLNNPKRLYDFLRAEGDAIEWD